MRMITHTVILAVITLFSTTTHAAPGKAGDDLDGLLAEKGLLNQIDHVRQNVTQVTHKASELVVNAMGFLGVPYKWGGNTAETGFDCSGFVRSMYQQSIGLLLPRKAEQQAAATEQIAKTDLQPGDLVFFNTMRRAFSHVGIYVGNGKFIHSPRAGSEVRVDNMGGSYWQSRFDGARRVVTGQPAQVFLNAAPAMPSVAPFFSSFSGEAALH